MVAELGSSNVTWRKSSRSGGGNSCVEVALLPEAAAIRDSKNPDGPRMLLSVDGWAAFRHTVEIVSGSIPDPPMT